MIAAAWGWLTAPNETANGTLLCMVLAIVPVLAFSCWALTDARLKLQKSIDYWKMTKALLDAAQQSEDEA